MKKSKYVEEILQDLKDNPLLWRRIGDNAIEKDCIILKNFGNTMPFMYWTSIVEVVINGKICQNLTFWDKMQLEKAYIQWMRNASIEQLK